MFFDYTDTLQRILESYPVNHDDTLTNKEVIENARPLLFDFDYPMFDEAYKVVFETNFIRNFYLRQVGFETYGLFKFQLESWLSINMPYFNKLFESELIQYDPLTNYKVEETDSRKTDRSQDDTKTVTKSRNTETEATINREQVVTGNVSGVGSTTGESETDSESTSTGNSQSTNETSSSSDINQNNFSRNLESDTPQNRLAITTEDGEGIIEYASKIVENKENNGQSSTANGMENGTDSSTVTNTGNNKDTSKVDTTSTENSSSNDETNTSSNENTVQSENQSDAYGSSIKTVDDYVSMRTGKIGVQNYSKMLLDYRATLLRIEKTIFNEMNELFMLVY